MPIHRVVAIVALAALFAFACDKGSGKGDPDAGDTDTGGTDIGDESFAGVTIATANAPDEHHVRVAFEGAAPAGLAGDSLS
ncbi:MAG TPA: hypothetical protein VMY69_03025, partial [Phycisphaerae bacterium]|nr:hypothetical protein [Phycisphaerae bacterium]